VIPRYSDPEMDELWSDKSRLQTWLNIEMVFLDTLECLDQIPRGTTRCVESSCTPLDYDRIAELEMETRHEVIAFIFHLEEKSGDHGRWIHYGMTSSDLVDTALAITLKKASAILINKLDKLCSVLYLLTKEHADVPMIGRTHGMHAEPLTLGFVLAGHLHELRRGIEYLEGAREKISVGKASGAVGTGSHHPDSRFEKLALNRLDLRVENVATQIVARDRHAYYFSMLALVASALERLALNVRHWSRTEVGEAAEDFKPGQGGSSAMPHKKNPISAENICGISRLVRSYVAPAFENIPLWHERDISHSSVERVAFPDATTLLAYMIERTEIMMKGLHFNKEALNRNIASSSERSRSEDILLALIRAGMSRRTAYYHIQDATKKDSFRKALKNNKEVLDLLGQDGIDKCLDSNTAYDRCVEIISMRS
jgi:adenylosuccinate lyase